MLEAHLPVPNVHWAADSFDITRRGQSIPAACPMQPTGRYAAARRSADAVILTRDRLGLNKLYFAIDNQRGVVAGNYLADLVQSGIPFDAIYAVPAANSLIIDMQARTLHLDRGTHPDTGLTPGDPDLRLAHLAGQLRRHIEAVAASHPAAHVAVCLSGGLDSALIAALARRAFANVVAYTYAFDDQRGWLSPDATAARQLADWLGIPFRLVTASADKVISVLPRAYRLGQDWRDFNVHCAIVNEILAEAIADDLAITGAPRLVLTGDLMNELACDYTPVRYQGRDYYPSPAIRPDLARASLVRGLQCGDREVGVFAGRDLVVLQPYAQISHELLQLPAGMPKARIIRAMAGDLLPGEWYDRPKARAQIGGPTATHGILPLMVDTGRVGDQLEHEFCDAIGAASHPPLRGRIRAGVYRFPASYPSEAA
jgi:asparagine synthetase B (glutamine-hydrolysing)